MSQNVSSAPVVIGALRVMVLNKKMFNNVLKARKITNGPLGSCRFPIFPFNDIIWLSKIHFRISQNMYYLWLFMLQFLGNLEVSLDLNYNLKMDE